MKILLVRPPATFAKGSAKPSISLPLGLLYIAAVLEREGFDVGIFDAQVDEASPVSVEDDGRIRMGRRWEDVEREIGRANPGIVGITCPFTTQKDNAARTAEIAKKAAVGALTVMGGNYPTANPGEFLLKADSTDLVCMGEGEHTMLEIALAMRDGLEAARTPGTACREGKAVRVNPGRNRIAPLDDLPFPAYHLVDMESYFRLYAKGFTDRPAWISTGAGRAVSVITSRGCPFNCVFCSIHLHMGRRWRAHSAGYVLEHLKHLESRYGIRHVHFEDDNISADPGRFRKLLEGFAGLGPRFAWDTPNGIRVDTLTKEMVRNCRDSGCAYLVFGVESGNQEVLNGIVDKKLDLGAVIRASAWCREAGLDAMSFFVIGFPGETPGNMRETVDFALRLQREYDVNPGLFVATPLPGTRLEKTMIEKGLIDGELAPEALSKMTHGGFALDGGTFSAADVLSARTRFLKGYRRNAALNLLSFVLGNLGALPALSRAFSEARRGRTVPEAILEVYLHKNRIAGSGFTGGGAVAAPERGSGASP